MKHERPSLDDARALSRELTRLVLGIDAFYRAGRADSSEHLDQEGMIPVHWSAEEPAAVADWGEARAGLSDLATRAAALRDPWARDWLAEYALSVLTLVRWLSGEDLAYEQVVAGAVRVDPAPPTAVEVQRVRDARDRAVQAAGYDSFAAFREADAVAPADLDRVIGELLAEGERRTRERLPALAVPDERIGLKLISGAAYTAYCDYPGKKMWINEDVSHTRSGLKHLVGHEAYPGHYVHMGHRDALVERGDMLADGALVVTNTASSVLFEGIAERGLDLLNWRTSAEDAVAWWHNRLQWICSIEAAHALNTGRRTEREVASFLGTVCDGEDAWIEAKIRFVTHPLRAPFVYTYWWGGSVVGDWLSRVPVARTDEAVSYLYDRMHSPTTLAAHWPRRAPSP